MKTNAMNGCINPCKITVIGGGNIGTQFACVCASKSHQVTVYSSKPEQYNGILTIVDSEGNTTCEGKLSNVTDDISIAMKADVIFIAYPAYMFAALADMMEPYIKKSQFICSLPGTGGAEFAFRKCIEKGAILCGLQRVPAVARLIEYGKTVCVEGKRDTLYLASIPTCYANELSEFMSELFEIPCYPLPNYLSVTMTPSNPILHTSRLATLFDDYKPGKIYSKNPLFYGEWSDKSSKRLLECDEEHQKMLKMLEKINLTAVKSLVLHYDNSDTPEKMTRKITSIKSLHDLYSPMKQVENGFVPDFSSRYFTADFPYGLAIIEEIANIIAAKIPMIKKTMQWYRDTTGDFNRLELSSFGINTIEDIYDFYK